MILKIRVKKREDEDRGQSFFTEGCKLENVEEMIDIQSPFCNLRVIIDSVILVIQ